MKSFIRSSQASGTDIQKINAIVERRGKYSRKTAERRAAKFLRQKPFSVVLERAL